MSCTHTSPVRAKTRFVLNFSDFFCFTTFGLDQNEISNKAPLFSFFMQNMLAAPRTMLFEFQTVLNLFLVFETVIVRPFT